MHYRTLKYTLFKYIFLKYYIVKENKYTTNFYAVLRCFNYITVSYGGRS